jgi:hypothetical protein
VALETPVADGTTAGSVGGGSGSAFEAGAGVVVTLSAFTCRPPLGALGSLAWDAARADPAEMITAPAMIPTTWIQ